MNWQNILKKPVDEAIDDLEIVADKYELDEHDWSSVDDASDYLFEHKVKKGEEYHPSVSGYNKDGLLETSKNPNYEDYINEMANEVSDNYIKNIPKMSYEKLQGTNRMIKHTIVMIAQKLGVDSSGTKAEVVDRISDYILDKYPEKKTSVKKGDYEECEFCAMEGSKWDMREFTLKNPKAQEYLKTKRALNVPDSKESLLMCPECQDFILRPLLDKIRAGEFE